MIEFIDNILFILLVNQQHSMQRKCARVFIMYTNISKWCMTCTLNVYSLVHQAWALSSFPRSFQCCASSLYKIALNLFSCVPNIVPKLCTMSFLAVTGTVPVQGMSPASLVLLKFIVIFLLSWQAIFRISNIAIDIVFKFIAILLHKLSGLFESDKLRLLAETFPTTMLKAHAFQAINREKYRLLVVCKKMPFYM